MQWLKRIMWTLGILLVLLIGGGITFIITFNPNAYKGQIESMVKARTGRVLILAGHIRLSIFPWLGLRLNDASLSNPPGFGIKPFAKVREVSLHVQLLPLLQRRLVVNRVVVNGLDLNLLRNRRGEVNWAGLAGSPAKPGQGMLATSPGNPAPVAAGAPFAIAIAGIGIHNARVAYTDHETGRRWVLAPLDLSVGRVASGRLAPLDLRFHIELNHPAMRVEAHLTARLGVDFRRHSYHLENLVLALGAQGANFPNGAEKVHLQGNIAVAAQDGGRFSLTGMQLIANNTHLNGGLEIRNFRRPNIRFQLQSPAINLDHVMALWPAPAAGQTQKTPSTQAVSGTKPINLPVSLLRRMTVTGKVTISRLVAQKLRLDNVQTMIRGSGGKLLITSLSARLYGGSLRASGGLNVRGRLPRYTLYAQLKNVQLGQLLKDYAGDSYLTGVTQFETRLGSVGRTPDSLARQLEGQMKLAITNGSFQHSRLAQRLETILMILKSARDGKLMPPASPTANVSAGSATRFVALTATAQVHGGIIDNQDLLFNAIKFKANGHGTANLVSHQVKYLLDLSKLHGKGAVVPLQIRGPFDDLKYDLKLGQMVQRAAQQKLQQEIQNKLGKQLPRNVQPAVQNLLKRLF